MRKDTEGAITAAAACPTCYARPGHVCIDTRTGRPFTGHIVHTERVKAADCYCARVMGDGTGPWHIIPNPACPYHGDTDG